MKKNLIITLMLTTMLTVSAGYTNVSAVSAEEIVNKSGLGSLGGEITGEGGNGNITTPQTSNIQSKKVMISNVSVDKETIEPGKPFTLTFRVENISVGKITGLSLKVVNVEGKGTLEGFMPVGTTNEIYVGSIGYNDVKDVSITLCSDVNTKSGVYNFVTSVMFSQNGGEEEEITKVAGVMIKTNPELQLLSLENMGENIMGTLSNDSKAQIKKANVKVKIGSEEYTQNIGNIAAESEEFFEIMISPVETETNAQIEVTYEDATGGQYIARGECKVYPIPTEEKDAKPSKKGFGFVGFVKRLFGFGI